VIGVPVNKSLDIDQGLDRCRLHSQCIVVAHGSRSAESRCFPIMINFDMNLMHATGVAGKNARAVAGGENVEGRIVIQTIGIRSSTIDRVVKS
jgi:hypothetical protein